MSENFPLRMGLTYTFALDMHRRLRDIADARFRGNRSVACEHFIVLGMAAEEAGFTPPAAVSPRSPEPPPAA